MGENEAVQYIVHDEGDSVGVVVVEGVVAGQELAGWVMDQDKMVSALASHGPSATIAVMPKASSTIPRLSGS